MHSIVWLGIVFKCNGNRVIFNWLIRGKPILLMPPTFHKHLGYIPSDSGLSRHINGISSNRTLNRLMTSHQKDEVPHLRLKPVWTAQHKSVSKQPICVKKVFSYFTNYPLKFRAFFIPFWSGPSAFFFSYPVDILSRFGGGKTSFASMKLFLSGPFSKSFLLLIL